MTGCWRSARWPADRPPLRPVLVGRDEEAEGAIRARIAREGLGDRVLLTGEVGDAELRRRYARADRFALFSRYEAFGFVCLEALAHGLPPGWGATVVPPFDAAAAEGALFDPITSDGRRAAVRSVDTYREALARRDVRVALARARY